MAFLVLYFDEERKFDEQTMKRCLQELEGTTPLEPPGLKCRTALPVTGTK